MSVTRQVVVDDTDPSIMYTGIWSQDEGISGIAKASEDKIMGPAYNGTSTFTEEDSSLSYSFLGAGPGDQVILFGGINFVPTGTFGACSVDNTTEAGGNSTVWMTQTTSTGDIVGTNNNILCLNLIQTYGEHVLTFNLSGIGSYVPAPGANGSANRVWVDNIVYSPTKNVSLDTVPAIWVYPTDPEVLYSAGWALDSHSSAQVTSDVGATATFTFQGTSVDYYGMLITNTTQNASSTASYSIDRNTPVSFPIVDFDTGTTPNNVPLFRSGTLPAGQHTLTVVNHGHARKAAPLSLQALLVVPSANLSSTSQPPTVSPTSNSGQKQTVISAIIGAVLGAVALLLLFLLLFLRRRRRQHPHILLPETPIPLPLPIPGQGDYLLAHETPHYSNGKRSLNVPQPHQSAHSRRDRKSRPGNMPAEPVNDTTASTPLPLEPPPLASNSRPLSDLIINHDDSGIRLPQLDEEPVRRVVEFPPTYSP